MSMKNGFMAAAAAAALLLTGCASQGTTETGGVSPAPSACASGACEQPMPVASCKGMSSCKGRASCKGQTRRHKRVKPVTASAAETTATDSITAAQ